MRKSINMLCIGLGGFSASLALAQTSLPSLTFDDVRAKLLDQSVFVYDGENYGSRPRDVLTSMGDWMIAKQATEGSYKLSYPGTWGTSVKSPIVGKTALIVSVERSPDQGSGISNKVDIFGKAVAPQKNFDPEVTIIARLENSDDLIGVSGKFQSIYGRSLMKPDDVNRLKHEVQTYLSRKIGSTIYNLRYTEMLPPDLDINEIVSSGVRKGKRDTEVPNLTPLKIIDALYVDSDNVVVLKVELPSRDIRLIFGSLDHYYLARDYKATPFERMDISVVEKPTLKFSLKEINAIKKREIFRGMSRDALWASWGFEEKSNDWGSGGEQKIFHETIFVYLKNNFVRDWQILQ